jgi:hypothetical protein
MKASDSQLQQMFVRATDEVIPPAPWLETQVVDALRRHVRVRRPMTLGALGGFGSGLRLAAGLAALLIAVGTVAALLVNARLVHIPLVPGGRSVTVHTPLPIGTIPFTPSPPVRASNWPPGGPVPGELAGAWQSSPVAPYLHLGGYNFQIGEEYPNPNLGPLAFGNIVVNGSEIDFISEVCTSNGDFGFERFNYTLTGNTLVITRAQGPGQSSCGSGWPWLAGTFSRVS